MRRFRDVTLTCTPYPIVRRVEDGDLTKFIQCTPDGLETESVVVPMARFGRSWRSLCVSSQIGCARGCTFCETAQLGLLRNLTPAEIVGQVAAAWREFGPIRNIVFMGMGEPFDNFDNVAEALRILLDPNGFSYSQERIRVSTVGRTRGIQRLGALGWPRIDLAISLNAPNDAIRSQIMPVNALEPMGTLREALLTYPRRKCGHFMIEYVLIPGVNDAPEHAQEVAAFLRGIPCMLNVISYNPRQDSPWPAPSPENVAAFVAAVAATGQPVTQRVTKGRDQMAACGQLGNRAMARSRPPLRDTGT